MTSTLPRSFLRSVTVLSLLAAVVTTGCGGSADQPPKVTLVSIAVTPNNPSIAVAATQQFVATGTYSDKTTRDISAMATWTAGTPATASLSPTGLATGVAAGMTAITAKSGTVSGSTTLTVTAVAAKLVSIAVTPAAPSIAKGSTQAFTATGTYDDSTKKDLTATATWTSGTVATATISAAGVATGVAAGTSVITATSGTISGTTTLTVTPAVLKTIAVTPTTPTIAKGSTKQFTAIGTYDDNTTQDLTATATWASATVATATVSAAGLATGVAAGTSVISATSGTISGSTTLTVTVAKLVSIAVTPAAPTIATGTTQQFTATGTFDDQTTQDLTGSVTWASETAATATISNAAGSKGKAMAIVAGTTMISATSETIVGKVLLTVTKAPLMSIAVTPTAPSIAKGTKVTFKAVGTFADATTQDLTTQVTWASATAATATISNAAATVAEATGAAAGTSVISATLGTVTGMTTLTVTSASVVSIAVTPPTPSIAKGTTVKLVATGTFTDNTTQNISALVTWSSGTAATATVSNANDSKGLVSGVAPGTSVLTATLGTLSGTTTITVKNVTLQSINVTPAAPTIAAGTKLQFVATGFFTDGSKQDVTDSVTWASATAATATISNAAGTKGLATGAALGTSVIRATSGAVTDTVTLTVAAGVLSALSITPAAPTIAKGTKVTLTATGSYTDGSTQNLTAAVTWASATPAVATVAGGLVTSVATGTTVVSATIAGPTGPISTSVTVTVTGVALASIAVTPATPTIEKGTTQAFVATGTYTDQTTQVLTTAVTWGSSDLAKATISNAAGTVGVAKAVATGTVTITATSGTIAGSTTLTINDGKLVSIAVTPATPSIAAGTKIQLTATGTYNDGATQDITADVTWTSATTATVTILNTDGGEGLASAVVKGTSVVSAALSETIGGATTTVTGSTTLTVTDATLKSIAVTPNAATIVDGRTQQFVATGFFTDDTTQDLTDTVTWAAAVPATANISNAVDSKGLATGLAAAATDITATFGTIVGTARLTVTQAVLVSIAVTPETATIAKGTKQQFVATGTFSDGTTQVLTTTATWSSGTGATATISNAAGSRGLASSVAVGESVISAKSGTITGTAKLTVTAATLASIAVTPAAPSVAKGSSRQFTATGTYSDASKQDLTASVTWKSATEATATISNAAASKGLATSVVVGTTVISATSGTVVGMTTLTVTSATLVSIAVTPAAPSIIKGATRQFTATGTYTDLSTQDLTTTVTWRSATLNTATISNVNGSRGLATGANAGTSIISATSGTVAGMTTLTVTP